MNILVIFTGGTISSSLSDGYIGPNEQNNFRLINEYKKMAGDFCSDINFETAMPYYILSENLDGTHINMLADCIEDALEKGSYDGIIATHGTDTLQYTAAGLSYIFSEVSIPVILVSSNYILDDKRANGLHNFSAAVEYIKKWTDRKSDTEYALNGVYVAYKNGDDDAIIHSGARLLSHIPYSDYIYSLENTALDVCSDTGSRKLRFTKYSPVMFLHSYPGQQYTPAPEYVKAILIDTYHSGTLCTENAQLREFLLNAAARSIPVFLTGIEERDSYESTKAYKDLSVNILPKASPVAMYMKLWLDFSARS